MHLNLLSLNVYGYWMYLNMRKDLDPSRNEEGSVRHVSNADKRLDDEIQPSGSEEQEPHYRGEKGVDVEESEQEKG